MKKQTPCNTSFNEMFSISFTVATKDCRKLNKHTHTHGQTDPNLWNSLPPVDNEKVVSATDYSCDTYQLPAKSKTTVSRQRKIREKNGGSPGGKGTYRRSGNFHHLKIITTCLGGKN